MRRRVAAAGLGLVVGCLTIGPTVRALSSVPVPLEALANRAAVMGEAVVVEVRSGHTADGGVRRYVTLRFLAIDRGPADWAGGDVVIREAGGRWGGQVVVVDAAPTYRVGERAYVFLSPAGDGALRTTAMVFGKWTSGVDGRWMGPPIGPESSRATRRDLVAIARSGRTPTVELSRRPPEWGAIAWDPGADFAWLDEAAPARWDPERPLRLAVDTSGHPLGEPAAATRTIEQASFAWSSVAEARLDVAVTLEDLDYVASYAVSPLAQPIGTDVVLFGDPFDDLEPPLDCTGVLATGGYWRTTEPAATVNGIPVHEVTQLFVVFNDGFDCYLGDELNVAEVAAHELGHGLGLGHSAELDSVMRPTPYGDRGARLGSDDMDAAQCLYPQALEWTTGQEGGEWIGGSRVSLQWSSAAAARLDPGTVDLFLSLDDGETWEAVLQNWPNHGSVEWQVPRVTSAGVRLRVTHGFRSEASWVRFPDGCSGDTTRAPMMIRDARRGERLYRTRRDGRFARRPASLR